MAASTGPVIAAGAITSANELLFGGGKFNWRVVPATAGLALALGLLEKAAPGFAVGLAWLCVATVLVVPVGNAPTPIQNALKAMGYAK